MTQETPQSTRSWPWILAVVLLGIIVVLALTLCPKPKPVPADTSTPSPTISADGAEKQNEGKAGKVTG